MRHVADKQHVVLLLRLPARTSIAREDVSACERFKADRKIQSASVKHISPGRASKSKWTSAMGAMRMLCASPDSSAARAIKTVVSHRLVCAREISLDRGVGVAELRFGRPGTRPNCIEKDDGCAPPKKDAWMTRSSSASSTCVGDSALVPVIVKKRRPAFS